ncbi:MAG: hypothetical protein KGR98_01965 [Verrucomicrobia bacterium]|nr:hypothetical protein [Verrucomicrobiota bacterium]MDE3100102.1 hypothetical protein [Verrucomicrobiota bacterium]
MNTPSVGGEECLLKALILHDDAGLAAHATEFLERAVARAGNGTRWEVNAWRLDSLQQSAPAANVLSSSSDADLILFAVGSPHLSAEWRTWLRQWSANRRGEDAAVMLLGPGGTATAPLRTELEQFSKECGLAFLGAHHHEGSVATASTTDSMTAPMVPQLQTPALKPAWIEEPLLPARDWGINE